MGFKTAVLRDVLLEVGVPATVRITLEVGGMEETVTVVGGTEVLHTQSSTVATTLGTAQVSELPMVTRAVYDFVTFLPGVSSANVNRDSQIVGLPQVNLTVTMDGINIQDMGSSTDRFQTPIRPLSDHVEQVTVTTAGIDTQAGGQGATQIRYVTRSGTNDFRGSGYYYLKDKALNANYWFNNRDQLDPATGKAPKDPMHLEIGGGRLGGPIIIPGLFDGRNKAFFFVNYERHSFDRNVSFTRDVLHPLAQQGVFQYSAAGQVRQVNLLELAAGRGHTSTPDPIIAGILADIDAASRTIGGLAQSTDPTRMIFTYNNIGNSPRRVRVARFDVNLTDKHRLSVSTNTQKAGGSPSMANPPQFPGFEIFGGEDNHRWMQANTLRSTLTKNLVSETVVGISNANRFNYNFAGTTPERLSSGVPNMGGYNISLAAAGVDDPVPTVTREMGSTPYIQFQNTTTWLKGSHTFAFGGSYGDLSRWSWEHVQVPTINFGVVSTDPALSMFTTANFPGASGSQLTAAQNLYAVLTGRVSSITGDAVLNENTGVYEYLGEENERGKMGEVGLFVQDNWRVGSGLTLNYGVRWGVQLAFRPQNSLYTTGTIEDIWGISGVGNLFRPGVMTGRKPQFVPYQEGAEAYKTDWKSFAPSVGFAWQPRPAGGWLQRVLGEDGETVFRGAFSHSLSRLGMTAYTGVYSNNPGLSITAARNEDLGNLGAPLLFREENRLGPGQFPPNPTFPLTAPVTSSIRMFDPNFKIPWAQTWQMGVQRALSQTTAVEVRYVGSRSGDGLTNYNHNEVNIVENGFLDEFRAAQANLQANIAAGRGNTFAYFGPGTGTSTLPAYLGYLTGSSQTGNPAAYTANQFSNTTFVNRLALYSPNPYGAAGDLHGNATRRANALAANLPANFFVVNPDLLGGATITGNGRYTRYHSLEVELRRRLSGGFLVQGSYTLATAIDSAHDSLRVPLAEFKSLDTVRQSLKFNWVWQLPFGRGQRFGGGASGLLNGLISDWQINGAARVTDGRLLSFTNVRLVGMTEQELQDVYKLRFDDANKRIFILPQDIIDNTIKAFNVSATSATGYSALGVPTGRYLAPVNGPDCINVVAGECAPRNIYVRGPAFVRLDMNLGKTIPIKGRVKAEFRADFLNVLNKANFTPVAQASASQTINQVTSAFRDFNNTYDFGGRSITLSWRLDW
jgi:hypothetical protein